MLKEHFEFFPVDIVSGWEALAGSYHGIEQKILSGHLERGGGLGCRTRLLRFQPGALYHEHPATLNPP